MAEETMARVIQIRSGESFIHRFHGDSDPREVEAFEEEIRQAWAEQPSMTATQRVALVQRYLGPGVEDELACYPSNRLRRKYASLASKQRDLNEKITEESVLRDIFIDGVLDEGLKLHLRQRRLENPDCTFFNIRETALTLSEEENHEAQVCVINTQKRNDQPTKIDEVENRLKKLEDEGNRLKKTLTNMDFKIHEAHKRSEEMFAQILSKLEKKADSTDRNKNHNNYADRRQNNECFMCGRTGHYAQNCRSRVPKNWSPGKRKTPAVRSQSVGGQEQGSLADKAFGNCPVATAHIDSRPVKALLDTGSQVSVMTEKFYRSHLKTATHMSPAALKFNLTAANGTEIPYTGYLSVRVELFKYIEVI
ncbi:Pol polyprotein [Plakobranchus ocellatus]|uniref:Pol polyprotein n=1 Tax=Plakobranchus ocellatus TaxID=259542 RepID=A0AAV4D043_9GAST|nr:Pol polyprotein [Plakobranchus ocellatus]